MIVESSVKDIISFTTHTLHIEKEKQELIHIKEKFPLIHAQTFLKLFGTISEELERRKLNEKYNELY